MSQCRQHRSVNLKPHFVIHEIIEIFHHYLLEHVQVSDQYVWLLSNIESGLG